MSTRRPSTLGAVLGPDAHHQGDLTFEGRVRIDGRFTGRLYSEGTLELGVSGIVEGEIDVANAVISGRVSGALRVRERLRLEPTAVIEGKLDAAALELQPGATINGEVRVRGG